MGFLPPDDERVRATVLAIADELTKDDLVLRYRVETTDDGLSGEEGTFTICSFWLVSALAMIGEVERARALFEKLLSFAGPLLLYAEEIDTTTGQHLGNFPQAFTHLALIDAATRLIAAEPTRMTDLPSCRLGAAGHSEPSGRPARHRVVVVGGGFGGLPACRFLGARSPVDVTLLDRRNHHLFQPLLYQVATGILLARPDRAAAPPRAAQAPPTSASSSPRSRASTSSAASCTRPALPASRSRCRTTA